MHIKYLLLVLLGTFPLLHGRRFKPYLQCNPSWATDKMGDFVHTICEMGSLLNSLAMILTTWEIECPWKCNPGVFNRWLIENGGYSQGKINPLAVQKLGVKYYGTTKQSEWMKSVTDGDGVVVHVRNATHWVVVLEVVGDYVQVNDPFNGEIDYPLNQVSDAAIFKRKQVHSLPNILRFLKK